MDNREISAASGNRKRKTALKSGRTKTKPTEPNTGDQIQHMRGQNKVYRGLANKAVAAVGVRKLGDVYAITKKLLFLFLLTKAFKLRALISKREF